VPYFPSNPEIFATPPIELREPQAPFAASATLLLGAEGNYRQPWLWVEGDEYIGPNRLLPTRGMWLRFWRWADLPASSEEQAVTQGIALVEELAAYWGVKARLEMGTGR